MKKHRRLREAGGERRTSDAEESRSNNQRSAAGYHASENDGLGAMGIAFSLCDGGVGSGHGVD